ncbi:hypothetical protein SVI_1755 [Shewanella violacea DSS12]|uniref:Transmembrane protein n=1 Tax=Shewanella violacea (strain JCM 10179 / CIP 106290 / LMG 19151 / DSS12) TaxID=637905 RepID=D4ZJ77_SHEVD|nr:hypothetical protein SVI_1755 [Shewanella violacea DSS12]
MNMDGFVGGFFVGGCKLPNSYSPSLSCHFLVKAGLKQSSPVYDLLILILVTYVARTYLALLN